MSETQAPAPESIGWCVKCDTWQRGSAAVLYRDYFGPGDHAWGCCRGDDEPWGFGIWEVTPDSRSNGLWCECAPTHADQQAVSFGGCPDAGTP